MQTIFKSDFEFMQTFMTDLSQELKDCMVSCSAVYGDKSALTRVNVDIADKNGKVFLSIDLFKTCQMVQEGAISYSKVLASAITSAENTMSKRDKSFDEHSQEKPTKEFADNEEDDFYGITETVVKKEELPEFCPEDVVVLALNRKKAPKKFEEDCALVSMGDVILVLCNKNILEDDDEANDEKESPKETCSNPSASACPDAEYGLTDYETENMILSVYRKGTLPDEVLEKVIYVSIDDDVVGVLSIFDNDEKLRHFSKECLVGRLGLNPDELIARALRNMSLKWPSEVAPITNDVYVVKAPKSPYGATSLLYPNMLNRLFKKLDTDVFYAYATENEVFVSKNKRFIKLVKMANVYPNPLSDEIFVVHKMSNHAADIKKTI